MAVLLYILEKRSIPNKKKSTYARHFHLNPSKMLITSQGTRLSTELLQLISLHLKPRHLYKLLQTSKPIKALVDNESYWERVASHMHFRDYFELGIRDHPSTDPKIYGLYTMRFLEKGYYSSMNDFIWRVRDMVTKNVTYWKELENASLFTLESRQEEFDNLLGETYERPMTLSRLRDVGAETARFWEDLQNAPLSTLVDRKSTRLNSSH